MACQRVVLSMTTSWTPTLLPTPRRRVADWQLRYAACLRARQSVPFAWAAQDCAQFAAAVVEACTGLAVALPGYSGVRTGARALRDAGGLHAAVCAVLGADMLPNRARTGDVLLVQSGRRHALAVCNGASAIGPGPVGLVAVSMRHVVAAWRV